jgi:nucleotide-binding universal stress UspA family protein
LYVVHVRPITRAEIGAGIFLEPGLLASSPHGISRGPSLNQQADELILNSLQQALGEPPRDLVIQRKIALGRPEKELSSLGSHDDDLIVIGASRRRRWLHPLRRSISKYCATHARCPVLVVPPDQFTLRMWPRHTLHRSPLHHDLWKQFDETPSSDHEPIR